MNRNQITRYEQEILLYNSLTDDEKRLYFVDFFVSEIVLSLVDKRKENNISQAQLAASMKVKQSYISKIENLEKIPTIETIAKYCFGLNEVLCVAKNKQEKPYKNLVDSFFEFDKTFKEKNNILFDGTSEWGVDYNVNPKIGIVLN